MIINCDINMLALLMTSLTIQSKEELKEILFSDLQEFMI